MANALQIEDIFTDRPVGYGKKYPSARLLDVWKSDRGYLFWAAGIGGNPPTSPIPEPQRSLIGIAALLENGKSDEAQKRFFEFSRWEKIALEGEGMANLPRPSREECLKILARSTLLGGHGDLDGIFSLAAVIAFGEALSSLPSSAAQFSRIRILRYGFRNLDDYNAVMNPSPEDTMVIIDFSAHPAAALNLDHHMTSLSFWELGTPPPVGIFESTMPSCPRLLATYCGLEIPEEILSGCDAIDGALYPSLAAAHDLKNPFVALEQCLGVDVSDPIAIKAVLTLAEHKLDPHSLLSNPTWQARRALVTQELEEQRSYWSRKGRFRTEHAHVAIADGRLAPYSCARFRYLPFEHDTVIQRPYLITIRGGGDRRRVNLGVSRNPFFSDPNFFVRHPLNLGALAKSLGKGGGRFEAASCTVPASESEATITNFISAIDRSQENNNK